MSTIEYTMEHKTTNVAAIFNLYSICLTYLKHLEEVRNIEYEASLCVPRVVFIENVIGSEAWHSRNELRIDPREDISLGKISGTMENWDSDNGYYIEAKAFISIDDYEDWYAKLTALDGGEMNPGNRFYTKLWLDFRYVYFQFRKYIEDLGEDFLSYLAAVVNSSNEEKKKSARLIQYDMKCVPISSYNHLDD